jgi:type II secretory pathway component PulF
MTLPHRIRFYQQLAVLARAGVPMRGSLERMEKRDAAGPEVRMLVAQLVQGRTLGEAFAAARFSPFECHLVAAGERSAQLDSVFALLSEFWNRERRFQQAVLRQLYYPAFVAHLAAVVPALLLISQGTTAVVTAIVGNLIQLYAIALVLYVAIRVSWRSAAAQRFWLLVPIIGGALRAAHAYRWITALRMEFVAGVSFPDAVADAWRASGYINAEARAREGEQGMRAGTDLSQLVRNWRQLPRDWVDYFDTAEASGQFETTFVQLEAESAHNWAMTQDRMTEWVPKILYFAFIIIMVIKIVPMATQAYIGPIEQTEKEIDDAGR